MTGRLDALELINFRSHLHSNIKFDGRPLAMIGKNGAGKTNILEAISMFSPGRGLRRAERDALARRPENLGWKLRLRATSEGEEFQIENSARLGEARQIIINDKAATQAAMGHWLRMVWMVPSQDRIWIDSATDRRKFFDRIVLSFFPDHGEAVLDFEKAMRERNRLFKDQVRDSKWFDVIEWNMAVAADKIVANRAQVIDKLNQTMLDSSSAFPLSHLSLSYDGDYDLGHDWASFWADTRRTDAYSTTTKLGPHRVQFDAEFVAKKQMAALCSTGEQKALLISLFLANARALIAQGEFVVVLLDEVAAHLDEGRRRLLFDEISALDAQIVMTGTEAELFEGLGERGQYIQVVDDGKKSILKA